MTPPAILDVEASGFGRGSYPIEIGFVAPDGGLFCSLIKPLPEWQHWDESAAALHGITRDVLFQHGRAAEWVAAEINQRLAGQTVYCDAWAHDYPWLSRLFDVANMVPRFKLSDLRSLLSEEEAARWHETLAEVREEMRLQRHRASTDAKVLQLTLMRVKRALQASH